MSWYDDKKTIINNGHHKLKLSPKKERLGTKLVIPSLTLKKKKGIEYPSWRYLALKNKFPCCKILQDEKEKQMKLSMSLDNGI